ncbi:hypothetical protein E3U43_007201 [Larimichthys crocea]|uniref:Uncharacterized protein n=1 Tax=Larimichthys crocea TaxID=215358 RepID=A0ACD3RQ15_LARCR|nr:hypothetical protein E3U43_007201 [Larimichthys crocea]
MKRPPSNRMGLFFAPRLPGLNKGPGTIRARNCSKPVSPKPKASSRGWHSSPIKMSLLHLPPLHYITLILSYEGIRGPETLIQNCSCVGTNDKTKQTNKQKKRKKRER